MTLYLLIKDIIPQKVNLTPEYLDGSLFQEGSVYLYRGKLFQCEAVDTVQVILKDCSDTVAALHIPIQLKDKPEHWRLRFDDFKFPVHVVPSFVNFNDKSYSVQMWPWEPEYFNLAPLTENNQPKNIVVWPLIRNQPTGPEIDTILAEEDWAST